MENTKDQFCAGLPHFCSAGMQAPKPALKPEIKLPERFTSSKTVSREKPWSVFGEVYWI